MSPVTRSMSRHVAAATVTPQNTTTLVEQTNTDGDNAGPGLSTFLDDPCVQIAYDCPVSMFAAHHMLCLEMKRLGLNHGMEVMVSIKMGKRTNHLTIYFNSNVSPITRRLLLDNIVSTTGGAAPACTSSNGLARWVKAQRKAHKRRMRGAELPFEDPNPERLKLRFTFSDSLTQTPTTARTGCIQNQPSKTS